ncbi:MAG: riboflavin synthase [Lachnospiraceae bacterium]|nr:riboflavin synthase [Lachnospiraceae bacterium]
MFTGIVEETGKLAGKLNGAKSSKLQIEGKHIFGDLKTGDSVAVNGVCLTVTEIMGNIFYADVMAETLRHSTLGDVSLGDKVNLERAMAAEGRFGGHIVSGHIDGVGTVAHIEKEDNAVWLSVKAPKEILKYIVWKGSITIDGISLTVAYVDDQMFKVSLIPHTFANTNLKYKKPGDEVNLENDIIAKYTEKLLGQVTVGEAAQEKAPESKITLEYLQRHGF